jgi:hypothetical protein
LLEERGLPVLYTDEVKDWDRIGFAVAWNPPPGLLAQVRAPLLQTLRHEQAIPHALRLNAHTQSV